MTLENYRITPHKTEEMLLNDKPCFLIMFDNFTWNIFGVYP